MAILITTSSGASYTKASSGQLQEAIDALASTGGTIWVWTDVVLTRGLTLASNVMIDFMNHNVSLTPTMPGRPDTAAFAAFADVTGAGVRCAQVQLLAGSTEPLILVSSSTPSGARQILVEHIHVSPPRLARMASGNYGLTLNGLVVQATGGGRVEACTFQHLRLQGLKHAIHIETDSLNDSIIQYNFFQDIHCDHFERMISFLSGAMAPAVNHNLFLHVRGRTRSYTEFGIENVLGGGNHFDHVSIDLWEPKDSSQSPFDWIISESAERTYICAHMITAVLDEGDSTVLDPPLLSETSRRRDVRTCEENAPDRGGRRPFKAWP